jgi:hypothetical protein
VSAIYKVKTKNNVPLILKPVTKYVTILGVSFINTNGVNNGSHQYNVYDKLGNNGGSLSMFTRIITGQYHTLEGKLFVDVSKLIVRNNTTHTMKINHIYYMGNKNC